MKGYIGLKRIILLALILVFGCFFIMGCSAEKVQGKYDNFDGMADSDKLRTTVSDLSSETYYGRMTGSEGNEKAIDYVAKQLESSGIEANEKIGDYTQDYSQMVNIPADEMVLEILDGDGNILTRFIPYEHYREALFRPEIDNNKEDTQEMVLITETSQFEDESIAGKVVVVHASLFNSNHVFELIYKADQAVVSGVLFNRDNKYNETYYVKSASIDQSVYVEGFDEEDGIASFYIDNAVMGVIETAITNGHRIHYEADFEMKEVETANIIGEIKGDPGDETILIGAHLDHVGGTSEMYCPGALDNASGVATMLEVARVLGNTGVTPSKNIVFMAFNGEETGLRGSRYYTEHPVYDISNTKMINLDMVGSKRDVPLSIEKYGFSTDELYDDLIELAKNNDLSYDMGHEGRSDHINFGERGAEAVILINYDLTDIHTPNDTVDRDVDFEYMAEIVDLLLEYIDENAF
jgi:hypothetical protein